LILQKKNQLSFQDPASPIAEGIIDLHNTIFFWLIFIFVPVVVIFIRILQKSDDIWENPTAHGIIKRNASIIYTKIVHGTILEIIWTITPTIILILIAIPSFGLIYAMDTIIDPDFTIKVIGNQWYWAYELNYRSFLLGDLADLYIPTYNKGEKFKAIALESSWKLWSHNVKNYLFDSYTLTEAALSKTKGIRLLSVDTPVFLPLQQNIRCLITSTDVLHSFALPSLGVKLDATPGRLGSIALFIERPGQYFGQCSELCGVQHGFMSIEVFALGFFSMFKKKKKPKTKTRVRHNAIIMSWEVWLMVGILVIAVLAGFEEE